MKRSIVLFVVVLSSYMYDVEQSAAGAKSRTTDRCTDALHSALPMPPIVVSHETDVKSMCFLVFSNFFIAFRLDKSTGNALGGLFWKRKGLGSGGAASQLQGCGRSELRNELSHGFSAHRPAMRSSRQQADGFPPCGNTRCLAMDGSTSFDVACQVPQRS